MSPLPSCVQIAPVWALPFLILSQIFADGQAAAAPLDFTHGPMTLTFDEGSGALLRISADGRELARTGAETTPITFSAGPADKPVWLEQRNWTRKLLRHSRPSPEIMELTVSAGPLELVERYRLQENQARLDRSVTLINRGTETLLLRQLAFRTVGLRGDGPGFYRFPAAWPPGGHAFAEMQPGTKRRGSGNTLAPLLAELSPRASLLWASHTADKPWIEVWEGQGEFEVRQWLEAATRLGPGQAQDYGWVTLELIPESYWNALPRLWEWMDSVGVNVPADRPAWVQDAILYSFHPGGTIGSQFRDLGGFEAARTRLLPTLPRLGVNALWIMPVEYRSPYWPLDYYRFMEGLGDGAQYKALVDAAHGLGFHVWQDLVPHGGAPSAVHNVAHPEFMLRREDGSHLDYWLNDFAWPEWQRYIADVARHCVTRYGVDGYRVDACFGSKEVNWNPAIPYERASYSLLHGGLGMLRGIRGAVRTTAPRDGAILAEVESARHAAEADAVYDFGFCYRVCRQWLQMDAPAFAAALADFLEEQKYAEPRGTVRLRHIESHDALRSQGWYGVRGMRALYALSAWIDGMPLIYHGMETGHGFELAQINALRRQRPELARGEALYRAVRCDVPGVFTCLRRLENRASVVAINFNRAPVQARLDWPGGSSSVTLGALDYTVVPGNGASPAPPSAPAPAPATASPGDATPQPLPDSLVFPRAREWFVDTWEGRLHDAFPGPISTGPGKAGSIYWRPQGTGVLWSQETVPLLPPQPRLGYRDAGGDWQVYEFAGEIPASLRLAEREGNEEGLRLLGTGGAPARLSRWSSPPPAPDVTAGWETQGVSLRCVGPEYIVSNAHFTVHLSRQGGVLREWKAGKEVLASRQNLYGDQEYFALRDARRIEAAHDVECGARIWTAPDGLHLRFEGQLRGDYRFALKRPPLSYRTEYLFHNGPGFTQRWAFRTEKDIRAEKGFLTWVVGSVAGDQFRFERQGQLLTEGPLGESNGRQGQTAALPRPDAFCFLRQGKPLWSLRKLELPADAAPNAFVQGRMLFLTQLDRGPARLDAGRWHEFAAQWVLEDAP